MRNGLSEVNQDPENSAVDSSGNDNRIHGRYLSIDQALRYGQPGEAVTHEVRESIW